MKNVFKVLGLIALTAVIGFSFVTCGDDGGGGGETKHSHNNWDWENYTSGSGLRECQTDGCTVKAGVGDTGPAGGKIIYANATKITAYDANYLEAATSNQGTSIKWCNCSHDSSCNVTGAKEHAIGTGKANTVAIIAHTAHSSNTASNNAAKAANITIGGKDDWFLPSTGELTQMYNAKSHLGISTGEFWSSSQGDDNNSCAWSRNFNNGNQYLQSLSLKYGTYSVRAIRAF